MRLFSTVGLQGNALVREREMGKKTPKVHPLMCFFQECGVTCSSVTWSWCEFTAHQMSSLKAASHTLCFVLALFHTGYLQQINLNCYIIFC